MQAELSGLLKERGASLVGCADLSMLSETATRGYRRALSIAVALDKEVVRGIPTGPHCEYEHEYDSVNLLLDSLGAFTEGWLQARGEEAYAVTGQRAPYERDVCRTELPHKTVARLAGHGWIGKSALLITPQFGSAVRLTTVLTNADVSTNNELQANRCGDCRQCTEACPGAAISGRLWTERVDRDELVSTAKCQEVFRIRSQQSGQCNGTCGICIAACPYTRRYLGMLF